MSEHYNASQITVLKGLESVRQNVGMYVGDSDKKGLHHLIWEVVDNSIDEALAGYCNEISIVISEDGETCTVSDNGRGIPVDKHPVEKKSALEVVLTTLHAGGKFDNGGYTAAGGLHGVGVSCVNALSDKLIATVKRDGFVWQQEYSRGTPQSSVKKIREMKRGESTGTSICLHADNLIFKKSVKFSDKMLVNRLQEMAFLNPSLKITYINKESGLSETWQYVGGLQDYLKHIAQDRECYPAEPIFGEASAKLESRDGICNVKIAVTYIKDDDNDVILGFTNNINQPDGGTHISGFKTALTRAVNQIARNLGVLKEKSENLKGEDVREGLHALVSIRFPRPEFTSQTKSKLGSTEAESVVSNIAYDVLTKFFEKNVGVLKQIVERATLAAAARSAAKKQSELIKRKGFLGKRNRMPGKLFDCNSGKKNNSEIFIVEGDSAAGSAKDGRDPEFQAILPIRGKIINTEKQTLKSILANKEVQSLITAIGTGIKDDFDISKVRYSKIILMADADDDGSHITTLLLTFFYRFMYPLISEGYVYLAKPPLYCISHNKGKIYCFNDEELKQQLKKQNGRVVRFKGLGEMDAEQLAETTMIPEKRQLIQLTISDAAEAEKTVSVLMGSDISARKQHIANQVNSTISK